jgi:excisionase family DNA binding protein
VTQLLSATHAALRLDCSPGHVYNLIAIGRLRAVEIKAFGTRPKTRVREEDLEAFIEAQTRVASGKRWDGGGRGEVRRIDGT